ncbi:tautomerase family protein [Noviherbaspirillum saxi]|uniref:Tautomerase family protein n=1 Tax=Noviherbaspirillum saxi TaxID=2320863 RepID=A0A3A3FKB6_9BURK|nr:tautomerase family protein [Noviherbaspirillum saxi]RJF95968.1 tautomerase family protein [Noviherbaspirillum saxi]
MPFVSIFLPKGSSAEAKRHVSDAVHQALTETFNVPADDRFQVISERGPDELICTPSYLGISHTSNVVFVQVACREGRTVDMKKALFRRMAELVSESGVFLAADVFINLVEVKKENWSFGNGLAQYA